MSDINDLDTNWDSETRATARLHHRRLVKDEQNSEVPYIENNYITTVLGDDYK